MSLENKISRGINKKSPRLPSLPSHPSPLRRVARSHSAKEKPTGKESNIDRSSVFDDDFLTVHDLENAIEMAGM